MYTRFSKDSNRSTKTTTATCCTTAKAYWASTASSFDDVHKVDSRPSLWTPLERHIVEAKEEVRQDVLGVSPNMGKMQAVDRHKEMVESVVLDESTFVDLVSQTQSGQL